MEEKTASSRYTILQSDLGNSLLRPDPLARCKVSMTKNNFPFLSRQEEHFEKSDFF
jgi:hypothetical protein